MTSSLYDCCPHMLFNKSYAQRIRSIPFTIFPDRTIDTFTNVNVKCGNLNKSNIPTVAYENFVMRTQERPDQRNFIKDFYMENYSQSQMILNNNIVHQLKQDMSSRNAYALADGATKQYERFQNNRKNALKSARNRAQSAYHGYSVNQKQQKQKNFDQNGYWLKKLYRKLEEVARSIVQGKAAIQGQRQKQFLLSKTNLTANFLSQIKIRDPKSAFQIAQELRTLMQKKKLLFSDQREQQQLNKSVSMSYTSEVSQNTSQGSMLSQATSINDSNVFGEQELVNKYCDFQLLIKKWNLQDVTQVKNMICRILTRQVILDAELQAVKNRNQQAKINQNLRKALKQKNKEVQKNQKQIKVNSKAKTNKKKTIQVKEQTRKSCLTKQEQLAKTKLIQGGRFDAVGQKYSRNRIFSQIFKKKQNQIKTKFVQNVQNEQKEKIATKDNSELVKKAQTNKQKNKIPSLNKSLTNTKGSKTATN